MDGFINSRLDLIKRKFAMPGVCDFGICILIGCVKSDWIIYLIIFVRAFNSWPLIFRAIFESLLNIRIFGPSFCQGIVWNAACA